jgi:hypothetical protein
MARLFSSSVYFLAQLSMKKRDVIGSWAKKYTLEEDGRAIAMSGAKSPLVFVF